MHIYVVPHTLSNFSLHLEIPLFHIMTAKVTFGNINGVDSAATHVTLSDTSRDHMTTVYSSTASSSGAADGLKQRRQRGSSESSADCTGTYGYLVKTSAMQKLFCGTYLELLFCGSYFA